MCLCIPWHHLCEPEASLNSSYASPAENPPEPQVEGGDYLLAYAGPDGVTVVRKEEEDSDTDEEWEFDEDSD
eukprot:SAG22_NODE_17657_length_300_cov_4.194030_1_plen_72_part_00